MIGEDGTTIITGGNLSIQTPRALRLTVDGRIYVGTLEAMNSDHRDYLVFAEDGVDPPDLPGVPWPEYPSDPTDPYVPHIQECWLRPINSLRVFCNY